MTVKVEDELAGLRRELSDLEWVTSLPSPLLHPHTMDIARAKIAKLKCQITELDKKRDATGPMS